MEDAQKDAMDDDLATTIADADNCLPQTPGGRSLRQQLSQQLSEPWSPMGAGAVADFALSPKSLVPDLNYPFPVIWFSLRSVSEGSNFLMHAESCL